MRFEVFNMDVFEGLKRIKKNSVDCVVTSPPYYGLRNYGVEGQIGLEKHPQEYINKLVKVFREVKKVLKPTGSIWLNLGDTYWGSYGGFGAKKKSDTGIQDVTRGFYSASNQKPPMAFKQKENWLQPKQKMLMPHRVAIALQDDEWICRNDIVWHKLSHMPSSVKDRCTNSFEFLFHFVKQKKYFYDLDSIREPHQESSIARAGRAVSNKHKYSGFQNNPKNVRPNIKEFNPGHDIQGSTLDVRELNIAGKNPADVWSLTNEPFSEAHFACFPTKLVRQPLLATCPQWICVKCGKPRERIVEIKRGTSSATYGTKHQHAKNPQFSHSGRNYEPIKNIKTIGFSDCGCGKGWRAGVVLDPFVGSGTTLLEAQNQGKSGIGIELNEKYIDLVKLRLNGDKNQLSLNKNKIIVYR